jgi:RNA:NAD 2'-phosphotransferase (TPT1/KptA family)
VVTELELDEEGWAPVDQLLDALPTKRCDWKSVERSSLERMLTSAAKRRHELDDDRIRALYGHSLPGHTDIGSDVALRPTGVSKLVLQPTRRALR